MRAELEERKAMRKARAQKADDFADADLKNINAHTDVVQSQADARRTEAEATRDVAKGTGDFLSKSGDAAVKKESGWFK